MSGEITFPSQTAPGANSMESGGRLINAYAEKAPEGSRSKVIIRRAPGLVERFATEAGHRGALLVASTLYVVSDDIAYSVTKSGSTYTVTALTGDDITGSGKIFIDRNMNATPQVLIVHSAGMSQINTGAGTVADFSDADLPAVNSICFVGGYFFVGVGDGRCFASGLNAVTFGANDFARAESMPDGLVRVVRHGSYLAMMGQKSIEFWSNTGNPTGFPFSFSSMIPVGLLTPHAVAGYEMGFDKGLVLVAADRTVQHLGSGFAPRKISPPDLDNLIEAVSDVTDLEMSVYVAKGHPCAVLSSADWTWVYDFSTERWHERKSYLEDRWRASMGVNAFDEWLVFDTDGDEVYKVDQTAKREGTDPLVWEARSTQTHAFPSRLEIDRAAFDFLTGVGVDAGEDPIETDPKVLISWSDDGGRTFGNELERRLGSQGETVTVDVRRCGTTGSRGRQWRLRISDPIELAFMGGAWEGRVVG